MNLTAANVDEVFKYCLYKEEEVPSRKPPPDAVIVEGITAKFGLNPERLEEKKSIIKSFLEDLPPEFHSSKNGGGGGRSFLCLCVDKDGHYWGEHPNMQELMVLAIATKQMAYCAPREFWAMMPGGMPYVVMTTV